MIPVVSPSRQVAPADRDGRFARKMWCIVCFFTQWARFTTSGVPKKPNP